MFARRSPMVPVYGSSFGPSQPAKRNLRRRNSATVGHGQGGECAAAARDGHESGTALSERKPACSAHCCDQIPL